MKYNGMDRLDSAKGYEKCNIVPCCIFCNSLKGAMIQEHWLDWLNDVVVLHGGNKPYPHVDVGEERASKSYFKGW